VSTLNGAGDGFSQMAFSADGNVIGSVNMTRVLYLWRAPSWDEIAAVEEAKAETALKERLAYWDPQDTIGSTQLAFALAWTGKTNEYEAFCRKVLIHAANTEDADTAERAAKSYLVGPCSDPELLKQAVALAKRAWILSEDGEGRPWYQMCLGLARYREQDSFWRNCSRSR